LFNDREPLSRGYTLLEEPFVTMAMTIRLATVGDAGQVLEIYGPFCAGSPV